MMFMTVDLHQAGLYSFINLIVSPKPQITTIDQKPDVDMNIRSCPTFVKTIIADSRWSEPYHLIFNVDR